MRYFDDSSFRLTQPFSLFCKQPMHNDRELFDASGLWNFVPPEVFDVHAHLYRGTDAAAVVPRELENEAGNVGFTSYRRELSSWMGDRSPADGLFFPFPKAGIDRAAANQYLHDELVLQRNSRGLMLIGMDDKPDDVEEAVCRCSWSGFKVYHVYAARQKTSEAEIGEFLPTWAWEIADRYELAIMLHMVRSRALADPLNQQYIREHCLQFPHARLILAHAARGFCGRHTVEGVGSLRGLDNVFFDTSAICEAEPFQAILQEFGASRLMFGSDFPVSEIPGRCVSIGDNFLWLYRDNVAWETTPGLLRPHRIGIESLLALRQACGLSRVSDSDVEQIFGGNARELLKVSTGSYSPSTIG